MPDQAAAEMLRLVLGALAAGTGFFTLLVLIALAYGTFRFVAWVSRWEIWKRSSPRT